MVGALQRKVNSWAVLRLRGHSPGNAVEMIVGLEDELVLSCLGLEFPPYREADLVAR